MRAGMPGGQIQRRRSLGILGLGAWSLLTGTALADSRPRRRLLAAAWRTDDGGGSHVGFIAEQGDTLQVVAARQVPSRAHGLLVEPGGTLLAVARRPGDWLMRLDRQARVLALAGAEPERALNGHVLSDAAGSVVYTSETDLATGAGLIGVRDARTLDKRDEWLCHGNEPHALLWDRHAPPETRLLVANGGIETQPETGRIKLHLDRMDSSLVRLSARNGALQQRWRLQDRCLSLRHLAWWGEGPDARLGIALQAQHEDLAQRLAAPVLAFLAHETLQLASTPRQLQGYGGDIIATPQGFMVSCPRADGVGRWRADGAWVGMLPLAEACALAADDAGLEWRAGGRDAVLRGSKDAVTRRRMTATAASMRMDNHCAMLP